MGVRVKSHALNRAFINQLQEQVNNVIVQQVAPNVRESITKKLKRTIFERCEIFSQKENDLWSKMGVDDPKRKATLRGQADFYNITQEMKNSTGFFIYQNGVQISGRNRLKGNSKGVNTMIQRLRAGSNYVDIPQENRASIKGANAYNTRISLSLVIFTTSDHSQLVNNPERKRRKGDKQLYQGTGWFDIYKKQLIHLWANIMSFDGIKISNLPNAKTYRTELHGGLGYTPRNPIRWNDNPVLSERQDEWKTTFHQYKRSGGGRGRKWQIIQMPHKVTVYLSPDFPTLQKVR